MALDCVSAAINTLVPKQFSAKVIAQLTANGSKSEAKTVRHINFVKQAVDPGGRVDGFIPQKRKASGKHVAKKKKARRTRNKFRLSRTSVARRVTRLGAKVLKQKAEYLARCRYVGIIVDEGNNFSGSCPLYLSTISCDPEFNWRIMFIGQANCAGRKDGRSIYDLVKQIFVDAGMEHIYRKQIFSAGTDGASVMRSTWHHSGLDCHGLTGTSFAAFMKRDLKEHMDFWHCLCHQFNLSLNEALDYCDNLKLYWIPHLRMCYCEFKRSSNNRGVYKNLYETLKEADKSFDWKMFFPALFCFTRWLGVQTCAAIMVGKSNRVLMKMYVQSLRDRDFGPRAFDPFKYRRRRNVRDAADAGADDRDGDDYSSEEEEVRRVQRAIAEGRLEEDEYARQPRLFENVEEAVASFPEQAVMVVADDFDVGNVDAGKLKKKNLLNQNVGLTDLNLGRSAYISGALIPYKVLVESLQGSAMPEQHLAARRIRQYHMVMQSSWIGSKDVEPMFACRAFDDWIAEMLGKGKHALVKLVKRECRAFCSVMVASIRRRLSSTWNHIQALELIDPLGPDLQTHATPAVWEALRDLCRRRGLNFHNCQQQIVRLRGEARDLDQDSRAMIRMDLCGYMRDRHLMFAMTATQSPTADYDELCEVVFSIPLTSSFVESLFSKMLYNQSKIRSRLADSRLSAILHLHDSSLPDPEVCLPASSVLKVLIPRSVRDKLQMNSNVGQRVCCVFEDGERYHGEVTKVIFHDIHAQYMYHVVYEDEDEADYWRHELEFIKCRCDMRSTDTESDSN